MPPKQPLSKKQKEAKQKQALEDQTFGLKNKNKSAKVQQFVKQVQLSAKNNSVDKNAEKLKAQKADKKLAKQLEEEEMRLGWLLNSMMAILFLVTFVIVIL